MDVTYLLASIFARFTITLTFLCTFDWQRAPSRALRLALLVSRLGHAYHRGVARCGRRGDRIESAKPFTSEFPDRRCRAQNWDETSTKVYKNPEKKSNGFYEIIRKTTVFQLAAVQKRANLVDLQKSYTMSL